MAIGLSIVGSSQSLLPLLHRPGSISFLCRPVHRRFPVYRSKKRREKSLTICVILEERELSGVQTESSTTSTSGENDVININVTQLLSSENDDGRQIAATRLSEKLARKKSERFTYLIAAVMSSLGITSMAIMAVYYRFYWQMEVYNLKNS